MRFKEKERLILKLWLDRRRVSRLEVKICGVAWAYFWAEASVWDLRFDRAGIDAMHVRQLKRFLVGHRGTTF